MNLPPEIEITIFDAARQIEDGKARAAFLDWAFRDSPDDGGRMKELLAAESSAQAWFQKASATRTRLSEEIVQLGRENLADNGLGTPDLLEQTETIGERFRLIDRLGEGGGGVVFRAEQTEPVQRRVAIKLLHAGMDTPAFLAAFQHESQALALMNHPNIAAILDAGTTGTGRPFLVMELVEGETITRFCNERRLTIRQRLDLFLQICSAIQHAHQKGIIHRDIKSSNILISTADTTPRPKVIDFGIASAIAAGNAGASWASTAGTPAYMSPEQADPCAKDIDTRADVFSLGVLLYELLAGEVPWKPGPMPAAAPRPSDHLASRPTELLEKLAGLRHLRPAHMVTSLRGDLDAIIMKALAPDRQQRYDTVTTLTADIQRHLDIQPVLAHPPGRRYLLSKFVRRNRLACLSGTAVLGIFVGGAVLVTGALIREREARQDSDATRATIAEMLRQSKARETVAQIAILLSQDRIEEADALLLVNPLTGVEPSMDATHVFRFLGERNALLGRWQQAADCFTLLMQANRLANAQKVAEGMDLLFAAPAMLEAGDTAAYDSLCQEILGRLPATKHVIAAEHVLKMCLLRPASPAMLEALRPMAELLRENIDSENLQTYSNLETRPWMAMSLATFDLRDGNFEGALAWCRKCEAMPKQVQSRSAGIKLIAAMAHHRLGHHDEANNEFSDAGRLIDAATPKVIVKKVESYDSGQGSWYAWAVARVLRHEAESVLKEP
jgi:hypothetical protein